MIECLYNSVKKSFYLKKKYWLWQYRIYKAIVNILYPLYCFFFRAIGVDDRSEIIISLTSFPDRIDTVWTTIVSLLNQSKKPKKVILWLAEEQFAGKKLPSKLLKLKDYGLEIRWCDDIKPHKKYYYCMQEYNNKCIVIADDDIFYPEKHLQLLWENYQKHPDCIIANKTHRIEYDENGSYKKYSDWKDQIINNPSYLLVSIGCNGVLYPPNLLKDRLLFDREYIIRNVLYTDDLWLKICFLLSGVKTFSCRENELVYFDCIKAGRVGLWKANTIGENRNDRVWNLLMRDYEEANVLLAASWNGENKR